MTELARPVGLGLTARGDPAAVVRWAGEAARVGLDSVWIHETYFERDAVTYAAAVAGRVPRIRVALGAVNPHTRHPVLLAMTLSALDALAPGRIILGLGTGLPLRLDQMGIAYDPEAALRRVAETVEVVRRLGRGDRLASAVPGVPEIEPMFPPVHRVPIYAAGYRREFLALAGRVFDGYLARPAEPVGSLRTMLDTLRAAARSVGRSPEDVDVAGYLLTLVDQSRRAALDRAKREPFVIYMVAVQSEVAMRRAGLDPELRRVVMAAWRAGDYTRAARLIPDDVLDAFVLCGRPGDVAERVEEYRRAGLRLPLLQPVVQDDAQLAAVLEAATLAGRPATAARAGLTAPTPAPAGLAVGARPIPRRSRLRGLLEITRPFSLTASVIPLLAAGALARSDGRASGQLFAVALVAVILLQIGTNAVNEIYDVRRGVDDITSPRASRALVTGRVSEREAFAVAAAGFAGATALGIILIFARGWIVVVLGLLALVGGWGYTAPPLQYKFRALGLPLVFLLMGPLMVVGGYAVVAGRLSWRAALLSVPIGMLVTAILHGNEWRDAADDARAGISTVSIRYGRRVAHLLYLTLVVGAFLVVTVAVAAGGVPAPTVLALLSLPLLVRVIRAAERAAGGQQRAIVRIDFETARLHAAFGVLLAAGLVLGGVR